MVEKMESYDCSKFVLWAGTLQDNRRIIDEVSCQKPFPYPHRHIIRWTGADFSQLFSIRSLN